MVIIIIKRNIIPKRRSVRKEEQNIVNVIHVNVIHVNVRNENQIGQNVKRRDPPKEGNIKFINDVLLGDP